MCSAFVETELEAPPRRGLFAALRLPRPKRAGALEVKHGRLRLRAGAGLRSGSAVLEVFERAQLEGVPLAHELRRTLRDKAELVGGRFRKSREAGAALLRLAARRGRVGASLRAMHETGVLGRLVPEWARITFLVQHDFFHKYTVDEHTLRAIDALDELVGRAGTRSRYRSRACWTSSQDARALYLGMLLHDIAKGRGGGHVPKGVVLARRILKHLAVDADVADKVVFLVGAHLDMSQTSQQRDLSEPAPVEAFAARVGSLERLNLLMLLTYADHCGVGPGTWNEWKASLLWELYDRTRRELEIHPGRARPEPSRVEHDAAVAFLRHDFAPDEIERALLAAAGALPARGGRRAAREPLPAGARARRAPRRLRVGGPRRRPRHRADGDGARPARPVRAAGRHAGGARDRHPGRRPLRPRRRRRARHAARGRGPGAAAAAARAARARRGGAASTPSPGGSTWRTPSTRGRRRRASGSRRPGGRAARAPVVRFDQEASALATVVEVKAPGPARARLHASPTRSRSWGSTSRPRASPRRRRWRSTCSTCATHRRGSSDPESLAGVERALLEALGARDESRSDR